MKYKQNTNKIQTKYKQNTNKLQIIILFIIISKNENFETIKKFNKI